MGHSPRGAESCTAEATLNRCSFHPPPHRTLVHLGTLGLEQEKVSLECDLLPSDMPEPLSHQAVETPPVCWISNLRNKAVERRETLCPFRVSGLLQENHVLEKDTRALKRRLFLWNGTILMRRAAALLRW